MKAKKPVPAHVLIGRAFELAVQAHSHQTDKGGRPFIGHVLRVAGEVALTATPERCDEAIITALLHDVVEDTNITLDDLRKLDIPEHVVAAVALVTKPDGMSGDDALRAYLQGILTNPLASTVKFADIRDNTDLRRLNNLDATRREKLEEKYARYFEIVDEIMDAEARERTRTTMQLIPVEEAFED